MSQVGPELAGSAGSADRVTVDASGGFKRAPALDRTLTRDCRTLLLLDPTVELLARLHVNTQQHLGMLHAAILRTLAEVETGLVRVDPTAVGVVRNQIG